MTRPRYLDRAANRRMDAFGTIFIVIAGLGFGVVFILWIGGA